MDFAFLLDMNNTLDCPEYTGYTTGAARRQGHSAQQKTKAVYLPLIYMIPSHPDTMMTSMAFAQVYTRNIGQQFVVFTCDLHIYRVGSLKKFSGLIQKGSQMLFYGWEGYTL